MVEDDGMDGPTSPPGRGADNEGTVSFDDPRVVGVLGEAHPAMVRYAALLADAGVVRGLIGPREVPRLWERHLLNSAVVAAHLPASGTVVDVGSGAGLPGVVLAAMRPDLEVVLLEPMERRVAWLREVIEYLGLRNARVLRGRAEDVAGELAVEAVTARAVAPMDRLAGWTMPLLGVGGVLLAMKGSRATEELEAAAPVLAAWGGGTAEVLNEPALAGSTPTTIVKVVREQALSPVGASGTKPARGASKAGRALRADRAPRAGSDPRGRRSRGGR